VLDEHFYLLVLERPQRICIDLKELKKGSRQVMGRPKGTGGRKGDPGSGRKKGTPDKTTVGHAGRLIKLALDAKQAKLDEIAKSRSYKAWEKAITVVEDIWAEYQLVQRDRVKNPAIVNECQDRLMKAIKVVLPYEKPKLQVVKLQGDKNAPLFDLSGLSDQELVFLRRTVLKAAQVTDEDS
jgi:hypothetical protein